MLWLLANIKISLINYLVVCISAMFVLITKPRCVSILDCEPFTYGDGCYGECGHCNYNQTCDPVTGVCENGCILGIYVDGVNPMCTRGM